MSEVKPWRPFEPSREAALAAAAALEENQCNRHNDCGAATAAFRAEHGRDPKVNFHCHDDSCEECFGY